MPMPADASMGEDFVEVIRGRVSYLVYYLGESDSGGTKDPSKRRENTRTRHIEGMYGLSTQRRQHSSTLKV